MEIFKTCFLMVGMMMLFMFVGSLVGGQQGMIMAFLIAAGMNIFSYFFSDKLVLKRYNAIEVDEANASGLYTIVRRLSKRANIPMPRVYIIPESAPNAFATGRNPSNAAIAITEGLLNLLNENEIEGVLAHELCHVKHYDILTGTIAAVMAGAIAMLANFAKFGAVANQNSQNNKNNGVIMLLVAIIMPIAATIIQMAISREREYKADKGAALLTGHPEWLANALRKLESYSQNRIIANATPQSAHMFIINPFGSIKNTLSSLFRTHPLTSDRIAELKKIEQHLRE
ncbi:zinc metalloprotease HtpX [Campylobacter sp. faydin G-24]|uniref:Protease HtpX homolog n=1 Tax=Campylobacter anatolicus TaxID=2829105 RepID=A0ABS5HJZ5_9BACT|nr:zinc metalloprotease HtpX [Campylobacter anatolicus]MBR8462610.1 zinc metalloprotease HtpX [Campylobacter anatolicus]MBR8464590.1 zinc metalloprotease HtpX [Campylobacter anatolicus]MBR8465722.1 zinc metalloprotease HtpX [Campylobacter anatolicus]